MEFSETMENHSYISEALNHIASNPSIVLLSTCFLLIYLYFRMAHTYWESRGVPQDNPSFPFGDMASVIFRRQNLASKLKQVYDRARAQGHKYVGLYFFSRKAILLVDPVLIRAFLAHFHNRGLYYDEKNDPLSAHLFSLYGPKWKRLRTKLAPAYSPKQLRGMFGVMLDCGLKLRDILGENAGQPLEIRETIGRYTMDVIGSCAYGLECNTMLNPDAEFRLMGKRAFTQTVGDLLRIIIIRSFPKLAGILRIGIFSSNVTSFFRRVVRETITYRVENKVRRDDFLQILIQLMDNVDLDVPSGATAGSALTMDEAAAQAFIFFLAGFETTSTTTSFAIFEMAMNDEIQEKARSEVKRVFEKHGGVWSYDAVQELTYLDMVLQETLRKYPAAPVFIRKCTENYYIPDSNVLIEEGVDILVPCFALHRDPEYFPNPDRFDPDRFAEQENRPKIWDYAYIPFGDGPRICIGMRFAMLQMKITLSILLQNYVFHINSKTNLPIVMEKKGILLSPIGGIWMNLESVQ
ncbi:probable cytochrome P450 6a14 isoform X2 [Coccinella septempunctata]|uniref:probable cytochrome P450 6a14 isoform X2 n=1 Tax=Coccinella septempunctata TaxID=41139 RepID=UPI001D08F19A|nr:probable cytochrome P450 6a14 isoform X2 [Coccinella septempunctata]